MISRRAAAAIAAMAISGALTACTTEKATPPTTSSTSNTTSSSPAPSTTTSPATLTPEQQAYAAAEKVYRAWVLNYGDAAVTFDATKVDPKLVTPALLAWAQQDMARFATEKAGGTTTKWAQDIKSVTGTRYVPGKEVQLQVCAVTNARFFRNGVDITSSTPGGPPIPMQTEAKTNQIQLKSADGGTTWQVDYFVIAPNAGASC